MHSIVNATPFANGNMSAQAETNIQFFSSAFYDWVFRAKRFAAHEWLTHNSRNLMNSEHVASNLHGFKKYRQIMY